MPSASLPPGAKLPAQQNAGLGLLYMALAMFLFAAVDVQGKILADAMHPIQIVWWRQLGLLSGAIAILAVRGVGVLKTDRPGLQALRGVAAAGSATLFIIAITYVPIADAVAVAFVAPFIVTAIGALVLREPVGIRRWAAVTTGFIGALIVIRPGYNAIHPAVFLVFGAAALFALRQVLARVLGNTDRTGTTIVYTALAGSAILTVPLPFLWQTPQTGMQILMLTSMAALAGVAELLVIKSLEVAQAVIVAPTQYTLLIWGTLYGYLIFGELPDIWTWLGALIIVATGVYTLHRERVVARASRGH